jgi:acetyl esterase/lipase
MRGLVLCLLLAGCGAPDERHDVVYDARHSVTRLDLYLPAPALERRPGVLMIHGGAWRGGDKSDMRAEGQRLARSGYVAASVGYRLAPGDRFPAQVQDCLCALGYLRAHAEELGLDPARIAVTGYSAGGHLSALIALAADAPELAPDCETGPTGRPAAALPGAGVYDLRGIDHVWVRDFLGARPGERPDLYALASPIAHVAPGAPPMLIVQGTADLFVGGDTQSRKLREALAAAGNSVELLRIGGGGHLVNPGPEPGEESLGVVTDLPEAWLATIDFLDRTLGRP